MIKHDIGINAGIIWQLLSEKGTLSLKEIEYFTKFKEPILMLALGWLARENKISFIDTAPFMYIELSYPITENYY